MGPNELALILTVGDILIDILVPESEMSEEAKVELRKRLQTTADQDEAWLEQEIARLKGTAP